jgi:hypothetical protein
MNIGKLKGPEKVLQMAGKHKIQEHESRVLLYYVRSQGSSVSIVSDYGLDDRAIQVRSPAEEKGFFL